MQLTLASQSAARRKLLADAGLTFDAISSKVDEDRLKSGLLAQGASPSEIALALAQAKAVDVSRHTPGLVIGADQTLDFKGWLYDKPHDLEDLRTHLTAFRGNPHHLHAAVALAQDGAVVWRTLETATLHVREFSDAFLDAYIEREGAAVLGCVGGYRIEGEGLQLFDRIKGDYFTILGLPMLGLMDELRAQGLLL
ncbi:MAG: Maf family protein [Caulobacteraceae bacterium]